VAKRLRYFDYLHLENNMTRILVIEDDPNIRHNISEILTYEGFAILEAENGLIGLQVAREYLPDLIICDITMPELDGYGVLLELNAEATTATIPFIFLTALADRPAMRHGMELGADDFLTKPFSSAELVTSITTRLERQAIIIQQSERKLDELRDELINTLPHELRTPLTGIVGYAELLMLEGEVMEGTKVVKMATIIYNQSQRLHQLIENYLLYAQIELIRSDPARVRGWRNQITDNPDEIIAEVVSQKANQVGRANDLVIETQNVRLQIAADKLQKIVGALVENALKFSQPGTPIEVRAYTEDNDFVLSIRDRGRGMTKAQIKSVGAYIQFERKLYEQQGSGLGLIIAKRLTELHGGQLMIESIPETETNVSVSLPLEAACSP
jgi:two-component system, sensor histidine kinase and response regulator